jgi:hypothetical protein
LRACSRIIGTRSWSLEGGRDLERTRRALHDMIRDEALALESIHPGRLKGDQLYNLAVSRALRTGQCRDHGLRHAGCGIRTLRYPGSVGGTGVLIDPEDCAGAASGDGTSRCKSARETFDWKVIAEKWGVLLDDVSAPRSGEINLDALRERVVC